MLYASVKPLVRSFCLLSIAICEVAFAGGGYFSLGYGPIARQTAGATTAVAHDAFAGSSNPAKLSFVGNRFEAGFELFNPNRKVKRDGATGANDIYNFTSRSSNSIFFIPEFAYARQVNDKLALGIAAYANGGLNSEYHDNTSISGTNANPFECGNRPGNFMLGCGEVGFDLSQFIIAPTLAWRFAPGQSVGISPLLVFQRFKAFGLQAFAPTSRYPDRVSNQGYDQAFGAGVRIGWYGEMNDWLTFGAAYSSKVYMEDFDKYKGFFAEGSFDIPANYSVGIAIKPNAAWLIAFDIQRIEFREVKALGNSILPSLIDPVSDPLGSESGSGFGWQRNQTNYKLGVSYQATPRLTLRAGYAYGSRPNDNGINSVSFSVLTPTPLQQASLGLSWKTDKGNEIHVGVSRFLREAYKGPSALFANANETVEAYVNTFSMSWTRHL